MTADWSGALARAEANAPFLAREIARQGEMVALLAAGEGEAALALARRAGEGIVDVGVALRREKRALALALAIGDLAGAFPLLRVTGELSAFADRALDAAIGDAIRRRVPDAEPKGFIALALGKHGAGELNYSSDIDPILLYDPQTLPRRERDDPGDAAQRVARTIVETLSNVTEEGYVFRVDLRLRPASEVSPLAIPIGAALTHYESSALAWERAAFIRARACAGDIAEGEAFLAAIRPFIWRRSLDFGAIRDIGRLTAAIRSSAKGAREVAPGFDIKKGRGGIREIEFYAQVHQLIHGGRNTSLRVRGTRLSLDALAAAQIIGEDDARLLGEAYDRLRQIEHRLQMVSDQQTHRLPVDPAALDRVAWLDNLPDGAALLDEVRLITEAVGARYDALIAVSPGAERSALPVGAAALTEELSRLGYAEPALLADRIEGWRAGGMKALRSDAARMAFESVQPELLAAFAHAPDPVRALTRFEQLLGGLPSAINLFRLLEARPGLIAQLADILSLAPPLADALARRADLLDPLIDASAFALPGNVAQLAAEFGRGEAGEGYEALLDRVRRKVGEHRFTLGVQLIEARSDPLDVSAALARVAEAAIRALSNAAAAEFRAVHGVIADSEPLVLGLGRMGGGALTHASDLDLVFLFTGDFGAESDGRRPLGGTHYYNRLSARIIAALSVPTAQGALYEVDTRLRPSGEQGPLAVNLDSFARYQREQAWTWEHMALCRARPLFGSAEARNALEAVIREVLMRPRDPAVLREDVLAMRLRMAQHKAPKGPLDVKLARGGLVDLEFLTHFLQLRDHVGLSPDVGVAVRALSEARLLPDGLIDAHDVLSRALVAARLLAPDGAEPPESSRAVLAKACGSGDWQGFLSGIAEARGTVAAAWAAVFGETLETTA